MKHQLLLGDSYEVLKTLPDEVVDCVITSPPYWDVRDYGVKGQLGQEKKSSAYLHKLLLIFGEIKRVLKKTGTCFVNIGDISRGLSLQLIPQRFAIRMMQDKWIVINQIIWYKTALSPGAVGRKFKFAYEPVYFFAKHKSYYFKTQFMPRKTPAVDAVSAVTKKQMRHKLVQYTKRQSIGAKIHNNQTLEEALAFAEQGKPKQDVWAISPANKAFQHIAAYPEDLVEQCLFAGCPVGGLVLDPFVGGGTTGVVAKKNHCNFIGIDLNPDFLKMATHAIHQTQPQQDKILTENDKDVG